MAQQYWVGEFFVDLSRNQISQLGQSQTLAPKALLVLTQLAKNRGKVVSYDDLLDSVWPNSVVTPNTLQRCIAQLRKALGENSKSQGMIKTHSKQGYSLEVDVSWSESLLPTSTDKTIEAVELDTDQHIQKSTDEPIHKDINQQPDKHQKMAPIRQSNKILFGIVAIIVLSVFVFIVSKYQPNEPQFHVSEIRYLTATDDKEYGATYSPDGDFILFHRYYNKFCINNIWAKNTETLEETKLIADRATYSGHSLSADGKTLVFIKQEDCTKPVTQNTCYRLMSINFNEALKSPQIPNELLHCQNSKIKSPIWIDEHHIAMLQKEEQLWRLIRFSVKDKSNSTIYQADVGNITHFAFSTEHQRFAVISRQHDGKQTIQMLTIDGDVDSSHTIKIPEGVPRHLSVQPRFIPNSDKLIFGDGSNLYTMNYQGEITKEDVQFKENAGGPRFHPDGNRLLLINGRYDSDIAKLSIQRNNVVDAPTNDLTIFERSINAEDFAKVQPNGNLVAFASERTGTMQVWVLDQGRTTKLSNFPRGTYIDNLLWDSEGKHLLVHVNSELYQLSLDNKLQQYDFPYPVTNLYHWDRNEQQVIANILVNGMRQFVNIDLSNMSYQKQNNKRVKWAATNLTGTLIFMDHMERFWQKGTIEDKLIEPLSGQGSPKRFVMDSERVYGINKTNQLWSYNIQSKEFNLLQEVTADVDYLTDINHNELLLTLIVAAKKEVIELSLTN
jgi:DNA-binding winged helix-turn-helix (wHTH) protein/Tol biopolymer transport system component